ncbi:MAG: sulfite exporter TauE/SafE family protein [Phycisphaerae bacterium]|nr:sulfite exporter TauE/SafE family protein [Phycisphaerae bacterium]
MDFLVISLVSAAVAALTLVSGFGLGTLLMPAFALFFPIEIAIAATGVVHFMNNLFKLVLVGRWARRDVVLRFGIPAVIAAFVGAALMTAMADARPLHEYQVGRMHAEITWLKIVIAALLALFAGLELWPRYQEISFPRRVLPLGGALSGFFGGVSGMQGALRAPFLLRAGLSREEFVGTTNVISTMVDVARLLVYAAGFAWLAQQRDYAALSEWRTLWLVAAACIAGFLGSYLGARFLKKVTMRGVRNLVAALLFVLAVAMAAGIV